MVIMQVDSEKFEFLENIIETMPQKHQNLETQHFQNQHAKLTCAFDSWLRRIYRPHGLPQTNALIKDLEFLVFNEFYGILWNFPSLLSVRLFVGDHVA